VVGTAGGDHSGKTLKLLRLTAQIKDQVLPPNAEAGRGKGSDADRSREHEADMTLLMIAATISAVLALTAVLAVGRSSQA